MLWTMSRRLVTLALGLLLLGGAAASAQDPEPTTEAEAAKRFQVRAKQVVQEYALKSAGATGAVRDLKRREEPLLRWTNPLGGRQAHGEVYLWTDEGRPAAALSLYELTRDEGVVEHHEWTSLAPQAISAKGPAAWSPAEAGIEFRALAGAPRPDESARVRLAQLRELAAQFTAEKTTRDDDVRPLRLLSQPLYRYGDSAATDGALFAFVEATDPEAFLLIESRPQNGAPAWHYALARMSNVKLVVQREERIVWQVDTLPWSEAVNRADKTYSAFAVR